MYQNVSSFIFTYQFHWIIIEILAFFSNNLCSVVLCFFVKAHTVATPSKYIINTTENQHCFLVEKWKNQKEKWNYRSRTKAFPRKFARFQTAKEPYICAWVGNISLDNARCVHHWAHIFVSIAYFLCSQIPNAVCVDCRHVIHMNDRGYL